MWHFFAASAMLLLVARAHANVEKIIFSTPDRGTESSLTHAGLARLTPADNTITTQLPASFGAGHVSWFLLDQLDHSKRYEVRVCWPATQPCTFDFEVFSAQQMPSNLLMMDEMQTFAARSEPIAIVSPKSAMYLRLRSTTDSFTLNKTLMNTPPPVSVDLILDPYLLNAIPSSLVPTMAYIVVISAIAWVAARQTWGMIDCKKSTDRIKNQ